MMAVLEIALYILLPLLLLLAGYFVGSHLERRHFEDIREREAQLHGFPVLTFATLPDNWRVSSSELATGNVVVSLDHFKRIIAGLRGIVGGRIKTYEPLLDRARREALLRMMEDAQARGFNAVVNVRLETSRLASSRGDGNGTSGVEMLAFGTALKLDRH